MDLDANSKKSILGSRESSHKGLSPVIKVFCISDERPYDLNQR